MRKLILFPLIVLTLNGNAQHAFSISGGPFLPLFFLKKSAGYETTSYHVDPKLSADLYITHSLQIKKRILAQSVVFNYLNYQMSHNYQHPRTSLKSSNYWSSSVLCVGYEFAFLSNTTSVKHGPSVALLFNTLSGTGTFEPSSYFKLTADYSENERLFVCDVRIAYEIQPALFLESRRNFFLKIKLSLGFPALDGYSDLDFCNYTGLHICFGMGGKKEIQISG